MTALISHPLSHKRDMWLPSKSTIHKIHKIFPDTLSNCTASVLKLTQVLICEVFNFDLSLMFPSSFEAQDANRMW